MATNHSDDLDELLDSALDDFHNMNLASSVQRSADVEQKKEESTCSLPAEVQGLGMGLPNLKSKRKGKQKISKESHVSEALDKLREQTREAVKGIESIAGAKPGFGPELGQDAMMEEWVKQFEDMAGSQDMESMVETMMQQLLSKEILHEPMKEIGERYPKWLKDNEASLSKEEYDQYSHQYEFIKELNEVYDKDPNNFTKIVKLMQDMQECGQPPNDIVRELAPDFDLANLGQLSPDMLGSQENCSIM